MGGTGGFGVPGQAGSSRDSHSSIFPIGKGGDAAMGFGHQSLHRRQAMSVTDLVRAVVEAYRLAMAGRSTERMEGPESY